MAEQKPLIIHVVRQFLPNRGGLEDVIANLCRQLPDRGYRVRVVTLNSLFQDRDNLLPERETISGIEIVRIPWRGSSRYPVASEVFKHLSDADILHVHAIDFFFDALSFGRFLHGKPLVATTHGGFFHTKKFKFIKDIWFNTISRISANGYAKIACCSLSDKAMFDRIAASRTVLVENGADTAKFANAAAPVPRKGMITIGRFSANKQLMRLLDMVKVLSERDPDWTLTIAGVPSDLSEADLQNGIAERGISGNVRLVIGASNEDVARLMSEMSLFVSASDYEGFGLVAIEAMSAGLTPVLEPNDAFAALAEKHDCVRLSQFLDPEIAANNIEAAFAALAADSGSLRQQLIDTAKQYAWETVAGRYVDIYDDILKRKV